MNKVTRKEKILEKLGTKLGFSKEDIAWITKALDPFHDVPIQHLIGYPDGSSTNTIVQNVKKSTTIERNSNLASSATWGFMLKFDDHLITEDCPLSEQTGSTIVLGDVTPPHPRYGGLTEIQFTSTTNTPLYQGTTAAASTNLLVTVPQGGTQPEYIKGRSRVISRGFEIHNTTAEIYKQGTITCFELPNTLDSISTYLMGGTASLPDKEEKVKVKRSSTKVEEPMLTGNTLTPRSLRIISSPPDTVSSAVVLPGSVQWEASKGAMMVQKQTSIDNPLTYFDYNGIIMTGDESTYAPDSGPTDVYTQTSASAGDATFPVSGGATCQIGNFIFRANKRIPYSQMGIIVSGLSDQSTFTVNWIETIERQPSWSEKDLIVLASPCPQRNDQVIELYSMVAGMLPVAVPVSENGLGDWFCGVVDSIVKTVSDIGRPLMGAARGWTEERQAQMTGSSYLDKPTFKKIEAKQTMQRQPPRVTKVVVQTQNKKKKKNGKKAMNNKTLRSENQTLQAALKGNSVNKKALIAALK